ncbi:IQ domain-containing protein E-like [Onthophagus taurus]|uniref:IQ domain-containing protein E-like n=1 Tax=Onthophagus taurus TaxID=166361 RepID=UPI000C2046D9|nr:IQ domain-containing protein E-like isoform X2 [Onthophagus taurus]
MFRPTVEDLQYQVHELKKQLHEVRDDNHLYKVKVRKLQDEIRKKDKQLEMVLDPKRANSIKKMLSQHGATLVLKLREENSELQKEVEEKKQTIKKLQWQIETIKLYYAERNGCGSNVKIVEPDDLSNSAADYDPSLHARGKRSKSVSCRKPSPRPNSPRRNSSELYSELVQENYLSMLNANLEIIKNNDSFKDIHKAHDTHIEVCAKSPSLSFQPSSASRDSPHQEIQQLHGCLMNVLTEVDSLKDTIVHLKEAQLKTHNVLEEKNTNIEKLASEIENLKQHQRPSPTNIKHCSKVEQKLREIEKCEMEMDLSTIEERSIYDYSISESRDAADDEETASTKDRTIKLCSKKSLKDLQQMQKLNPSVCVQTLRSCLMKHLQPQPGPSIINPASFINQTYELEDDFSPED